MNSLLNFIRAHHFECEPASNGRIRVKEEFVFGDLRWRFVIIPATVRDVRAWLGY